MCGALLGLASTCTLTLPPSLIPARWISGKAECSANAQCSALNLEGDCCPSADGAMLACCFNDDPMQVCDASQTSINAAMLNCSLYDATSGHYAACLYDYCATGGGAVTDAQADLAAAGTTTVDCPSYDFKVSQGATLLYGAGAASLNDHLHTQALPGVASEASCCEMAKRYACSASPVMAWQVVGAVCYLQRKAFFEHQGLTPTQFATDVAAATVDGAMAAAVNSRIYYSENPACPTHDAGNYPCAESVAAGTCTGNDQELCFYDVTCGEGHAPGVGCAAGGHTYCRFCGFGDYVDVACPGTAAAQPPATVQTTVSVPNTCPQACDSNPEHTCFLDTACSDPLSAGFREGLGCNAGGVGPNCRYCGFSLYSHIACPGYSATASAAYTGVNTALGATATSGAAAANIVATTETEATVLVENVADDFDCATACDAAEAGMPDATAVSTVTCTCDDTAEDADGSRRRLQQGSSVTLTIVATQPASANTAANDAYLLAAGGAAGQIVAAGQGGKAATATTSYTTVLAIDAPAAADADAAQVQQRIGAATSLSLGLQNERDLAVAMPVVLQFNSSAAVAAPLPPSPSPPQIPNVANLPLSEGLRTWVIAVIVVCILLALCVIGGALYCLLKRRGNAQMLTVPKQNEKMEVPPLGSQLSRNI